MDTTELKNEISKGLRSFRAFEKAHEVLLKLEGMEQTVAETEKRVSLLKEEESDLVERREEAIKAAAAVKGAAAKEARELLQRTAADADSLIGNARLEIKDLKESTQAEIDRLLAQKADLEKNSAVLSLQIEDKTAEFEKVDSAIKEQKSALEKLLRG